MALVNIDISNGWMPDLIPFGVPQGGLIKATNLLPYDEGYWPMLNKAAFSTNAVSGTPLKAHEFRNDVDGQYYQFIGTSSKLYRMDLTKTLTDVTKLATDYTCGDNIWHFAKYSNWVIATNYAYAPQVLKGLTAANFTDLGGTPPKAEYVLLHQGHLIFGYVNEAGVIDSKKLVWSGLNDVEDYTPSLTTGAGFQTLSDADGSISGMANLGDAFVIGHKNSLTLGYYDKSPDVFNFVTNRIVNIGVVDETMISIGDAVFFFDERDIYYFDGRQATSIGVGVRNTVMGSLNYAYLNKINTAHDTKRGIVYWAYPTTSSTDGTCNRILAYNYRKKCFTNIEIDTTCLFPFHKSVYYMDEMDALYPDVSDMPYPLDSNFWQANSPVIGCVNNTDSKVNTLSGTAMTGTLETGEMSSNNDMLMVRRVRPKVSSSIDSVSVRVATRLNEDDSPTYSTSSTVGANGYADLRATGRYGKVELSTGDHSGILSIDAEIVERGVR